MSLAGLARSLGASPVELVGLGILLAGGVVCLAVLVWWAQPDGSVAVEPVAAAAPPGGVEDALVTVHVVGAVARPGVVELPGSARVVDAVAAAGGATVLADVGQLNLARTVTDGERIEVPQRGTGPSDGPTGTSSAFDGDGRLDLNRASAQELESLPGIGPVLAQRIVDHREAHGPFPGTGALRDVPGIGERSFQRLVELIVVR